MLSARELKIEIEGANERVRQEYLQRQGRDRNYLIDALSPVAKQHMEGLIKKEDLSVNMFQIFLLI